MISCYLLHQLVCSCVIITLVYTCTHPPVTTCKHVSSHQSACWYWYRLVHKTKYRMTERLDIKCLPVLINKIRCICILWPYCPQLTHQRLQMKVVWRVGRGGGGGGGGGGVVASIPPRRHVTGGGQWTVPCSHQLPPTHSVPPRPRWVEARCPATVLFYPTFLCREWEYLVTNI